MGGSVIATLLFDVPAHDPVTFATVGAVVALVALMACSIPAARAVRVGEDRPTERSATRVTEEAVRIQFEDTESSERCAEAGSFCDRLLSGNSL
jgi:hypothetical protein